MTNHKTVVVDGKVVHIHEFDDGSTMVTGAKEALDKVNGTETKAEKHSVSELKEVGWKISLPYILSVILVSLPILVIVGAFIYAIIDVMLNGYTYR